MNNLSNCIYFIIRIPHVYIAYYARTLVANPNKLFSADNFEYTSKT